MVIFVVLLWVNANASVLDGFWELKGTRSAVDGANTPRVETPYGRVTIQVQYDGNKVTKYSFDDRGFMFKYENSIQIEDDKLTEFNSEGNRVATYSIIGITDTEIYLREGQSLPIWVFQKIPSIRTITPPSIKQTMQFAFSTPVEGNTVSSSWDYENFFRGSESPLISCNYFATTKDLLLVVYEFDRDGSRALFNPQKHKNASIKLRNVNVSDDERFPSFRENKLYRLIGQTTTFRFGDPALNISVTSDKVATCNGPVTREKTALNIQLACRDSKSEIQVRMTCEIN